MTTRHNYLVEPANHGKRPSRMGAWPTRSGRRTRWHRLGCSADGGAGLPPGVVCEACTDSTVERFFRDLLRRDRRGSGDDLRVSKADRRVTEEIRARAAARRADNRRRGV